MVPSKEGKCTWGEKCRFSHGKQDAKGKKPSDEKKKDGGKGAGKGGGDKSKSEKPCYTFRDTGNCKFGDKCIFKHVKGDPKPGGGAPPAGGGGAK